MDKKRYSGLTNASAAIALDNQRFIVADDERNYLSIYRQSDKKPLQTLDLQTLFNGQISHAEYEELDLEGAAVLGDVCFWIGSHSCNKSAKPRPSRHCLLGLRLTREINRYHAQSFGTIYRNLIADLQQDARFQRYALGRAAQIPPKALGGLSIEGLAATPEQGLLMGFRNPLSGGEIYDERLSNALALVVHLLNPLAVLQGQQAQFADPVELDLGGLGIRDLVWRQDQQYLIVAGPYHANLKNPEKTRLYSWDRACNKLQLLSHIDLQALNIEAAFFFDQQLDELQLLSDDGARSGFRGLSVPL